LPAEAGSGDAERAPGFERFFQKLTSALLLTPDERKQILIDFVLERCAHPVAAAVVGDAAVAAGSEIEHLIFKRRPRSTASHG
jgi:hypothetical protein